MSLPTRGLRPTGAMGRPMKRFAFACLAVAALGAAPASAADQRMPTKAPPLAAPAPVVTWTGCYIGVNVGGGFASEKYRDPLAAPPDDFLGKHDANGVVGGGQIGCDYQFGAWLIGAQGMFDGADLTGDHLFDGDVFHTRIPWFATATGRIGWLPDPSFLLYVKGGGAWKRQEETIIDAGILEAAATKTRSGYVAGGGFEWRFWPNWSFFAEYNYLGFNNSSNLTFAAFEAGALPFPLEVKEHVSVVVAGVNWRFAPWMP